VSARYNFCHHYDLELIQGKATLRSSQWRLFIRERFNLLMAERIDRLKKLAGVAKRILKGREDIIPPLPELFHSSSLIQVLNLLNVREFHFLEFILDCLQRYESASDKLVDLFRVLVDLLVYCRLRVTIKYEEYKAPAEQLRQTLHYVLSRQMKDPQLQIHCVKQGSIILDIEASAFSFLFYGSSIDTYMGCQGEVTQTTTFSLPPSVGRTFADRNQFTQGDGVQKITEIVSEPI